MSVLKAKEAKNMTTVKPFSVAIRTFLRFYAEISYASVSVVSWSKKCEKKRENKMEYESGLWESLT